MPSMAHPLSLRLLLLAVSVAQASSRYCAEDEPCVHFPVVHSTNTNIFPKRAVELQLSNRSDVAYYAQLEVGTPAQRVLVQVDTGSFELWMNPTCAGLSTEDATFCEATGKFKPDKSSTAVDMKANKTLFYGLGSANVSYFQDSIALPGATAPMTGVQFGVASSSVDEFSGIMGIGYGKGLTTTYHNFVDQLALQGQTRVKAFSIGLGSKTEQQGAIVFGGVDTSKFAGALATLPILPAAQSPDRVPRYWVTLQGLGLTPPSGVTRRYANSGMPVFLDTGATLSLLPAPLAAAVGRDFGADRPDKDGYYQVDCALNDLPGSLDFAFDGVTIRVPYSELIREQPATGDRASCFLGIQGSTTFTLLGDTFMRSAYTVFDLENHAVHMQQYTNCGATPAAVAKASDFKGLKGKCSTSTSTSHTTTNKTAPPKTAATGSARARAGAPASALGGTTSTNAAAAMADGSSAQQQQQQQAAAPGGAATTITTTTTTSLAAAAAAGSGSGSGSAAGVAGPGPPAPAPAPATSAAAAAAPAPRGSAPGALVVVVAAMMMLCSMT